MKSLGLLTGLLMAFLGLKAFAHPTAPKHEVVYRFTPPPNRPGEGGLIPGPNGYFWGTTLAGGSPGYGTIYKMKPDGTDLQTVIHFAGTEPGHRGAGPQGLTSDGAGLFWGTTGGGPTEHGTLFKLNPLTGLLTTVLDFTGNGATNKGSRPGALVSDGAGTLWGATKTGGANDVGTIFKFHIATGQLTTLVEFTDKGASNKGKGPNGLVSDGAGYFWGTTSEGGGTEGFGTIFKIDANSGVLTTVVEFTHTKAPSKGAYPGGLLVSDGAGFLWGTTGRGGRLDFGTVYKVHVETGALTTMAEFIRSDVLFTGGVAGSYPLAGLANDGAGFLWGTTSEGGNDDFEAGYGTVFKINISTGILTTVFKNADMPYAPHGLARPATELVSDGAGSFIGAGGFNYGVIFKINTTTAEPSCVVRFGEIEEGHHGMRPQAGLVSDGPDYIWGASNFPGSIFKFNVRTGVMTTVVDFTKSEIVGYPAPGLVNDGAGSIWGADPGGGANGCGTIFKVNTTTGALTVVAEFTGMTGSQRGKQPNGELFQDDAGYFWGTTRKGGAGDLGTIYKLNAATGALTTVIEFTGQAGSNKGSKPYAGLTSDGAGFLWGNTSGGGVNQTGTIFKLNMNTGEMTTVYEFASFFTIEPQSPKSALVSDGQGSFLGTIEEGGDPNDGEGMIYKFNPATGVLSVVARFEPYDLTQPIQGGKPMGTLFRDENGAIWGTTNDSYGGSGTVYRYEPQTGEFVTVVSFDFDFFTEIPWINSGLRPGPGALLWHADGNLYGTTEGTTRDSNQGGTIFRIRPRPYGQKLQLIAAPGTKGSPVPGEPGVTRFVTIGTPAVDARQGPAFQATIRGFDGKLAKVIYAGEPGAVIARVGQTAPQAGLATFKSFGDPVMSEKGLAFSAKLSDGRSGVWTTAFDGTLRNAVLTGNQAPSEFANKILSISTFSLRGAEVVALVKLGRGEITAANDMTLLRSVEGLQSCYLQEGETLTVDGVASRVTKLSVFTPSPIAPGQGRSHIEGLVALKVTLKDGREVALAIDSAGQKNVIVASRSANGTRHYRTLGLPCVGAADAIALKSLAHGSAPAFDERMLVDVLGQEAPLVPPDEAESYFPPAVAGVQLGSLSDPVVNDRGTHAFLATLKGASVTAKNKTALFWGQPGAIQLGARLDGFAPDRDGVPGTARFGAFTYFGLPDGPKAAPVFVAKLTGPRGSGVTAKNNVGWYGIDNAGLLRELLRTGQTLTLEAETKTVKSFTALTGGGPVGSRRAFTQVGAVAARVTFTDNSTGIVQVIVP